MVCDLDIVRLARNRPRGIPDAGTCMRRHTCAMHTCLSLSNIGGPCDVEHAVSGLVAELNAYCDSIEWCNIAVEGPSGEGEARCWRVDLKLRVFDEVVRSTARVPEGPDSAQSLVRVLDDVYASATPQLANIAKRHGCCGYSAEDITARFTVCA